MCWWIMEGGFDYHEFNGDITDDFIEKLYKRCVVGLHVLFLTLYLFIYLFVCLFIY